VIEVEPQEIAVIPRGVRFRVELLDDSARGYVCENFGAAFRLPDLGPIGSNGLANPRDFQVPVAAYEDRDDSFELVAKFMGHLWAAEMDHSPLDVVAWHGNHVPYKYDLRRFNTIGSISFDHPDPSIFLVLQAVSDTPGIDMIDFVIFPPRILAMEHTFRPPWFHRNIASEFMGLISGMHDSKAEGFVPGGGKPAQLHERSRTRCRVVRQSVGGRHQQAALHPRRDGVHVRDPHCHPADAVCARDVAACRRDTSSAGRDCRRTSIRSAASVRLSSRAEGEGFQPLTRRDSSLRSE